jgi:hypothetical protein
MIKAEKIAESNDRKMATIAKWRASGLSQAEFCRREGYRQWQLSEWRRWVEKNEKKTEAPSARMRSDRIRSRRTDNKANRPRSVQESAASTTGLHTFVPVQLVEAAAESCEQHHANSFSSVLELVLKRGQIIRVASNCPPHFLGAVVATLEH